MLGERDNEFIPSPQQTAQMPYLSYEQTYKLGLVITRSREAPEDEQLKRQAEEAIVRLVCSNLELAASIAGKACGRSPLIIMNRDDLIQEATIGLWKAAQRFDPRKGAFPPYAKTWITREIGLAFKYRAEIGSRTVSSMDTPLGYAEDGLAIKDIIADYTPPVEQIVMALIDIPTLIKAKLSPEQSLVFMALRGIEDLTNEFLNGVDYSLRELAAILGKSKSRIGQIDHAAVKNLTSNPLVLEYFT